MTREEFTDNARQICDSLGIQFRTPTTEQMKLKDDRECFVSGLEGCTNA